MGGTIGAFFAIFLNVLSLSLTQQEHDISWSQALQNAKRTLSRYTPAEVGDRTFIDSIDPFIDAITTGEGLEVAVRAAKVGTESTHGMKAHLGRAAYLSVSQETPPDPGAWGVSAILEGMLEGLGK